MRDVQRLKKLALDQGCKESLEILGEMARRDLALKMWVLSFKPSGWQDILRLEKEGSLDFPDLDLPLMALYHNNVFRYGTSNRSYLDQYVNSYNGSHLPFSKVLSEIPRFPYLENVVCEANILDKRPEEILEILPESVRSLSFSRNRLSTLDPLVRLRNLSSLGIERSQIKDLSPLEGLPIWFLSISDCGYTDFSFLSKLPELRRVTIYSYDLLETKRKFNDISLREGSKLVFREE